MKQIIKKYWWIFLTLLPIITIWYFQYQKDVSFCKDECKYLTSSDIWNIKLNNTQGNRFFPEREQCVDYCLRNK